MPEMFQPKKVLIVDDSEVNRYTLTKMIKARGVDVAAAGSGREALELISQDPDVALIDIHLPDMTGYELLETIRANPRTAVLPIVLMSATEPAPHARSAAASLGVHSFLTLPVIPGDLWIVIEATLHRQKRRA